MAAFIAEQAERLYRTHDAVAVLQTIRDEYPVSSFPSKMSQIKKKWLEYEDFHKQKNKDIAREIERMLKSNNVEGAAELQEFSDKALTFQVKAKSLGDKGLFSDTQNVNDALSRIRVLPEYMDAYKMTEKDIKRYDKYRARIERPVKVFSTDSMKRAQRVLRDNAKFLESGRTNEMCEDPFVIIACISCVTGRTLPEIMYYGMFSESESSRKKNTCTFSGKVTSTFFGDPNTYDIFILVPFDVLYTNLSWIASLFQDEIREVVGVDGIVAYINAKYAKRVGEAAQFILQSDAFTFRELRALYALYCHRKFHIEEPFSSWISTALLLSDTENRYENYKLS
jgi:hypothetical protein